jgi:hypothetical protein
MDEKEFIADMRRHNPEIDDYLEALVYAMDTVARVPRDQKLRVEECYFGQIGDGTFYTDSEWDHTRWYPDTNPVEAIHILELELGEECTRNLDGFRVDNVEEPW